MRSGSCGGNQYHFFPNVPKAKATKTTKVPKATKATKAPKTTKAPKALKAAKRAKTRKVLGSKSFSAWMIRTKRETKDGPGPGMWG